MAKSTIKKEQEIIIYLNNQYQTAILREVPTDIIMKDYNVCIDNLEYYSIRDVKRLFFGSQAVFTINNNLTDGDKY